MNNLTIPLMKNAFLQEEITKTKLADFILKAPRLSMGDRCLEFEKKFSVLQGSEYAVLFNSGGSANLALLQALKNLGRLKDGSKVAFSALTWSTNVMPIIQLGMEALPVDCETDTLNVSSRTLKDLLKKESIDAFFITNVLGFVDDIENIRDICHDKGILLIEDNCESLGTRTKIGKTGNIGLGATFSFYVAHHMSTIEGGMICTSDEELEQMLRITRANGWDRNLTPDQQKKWRDKYNITSEFDSKYTFYDLGFNLRPTEITGFLGLEQLKYVEEAIEQRNNNYKEVAKVVLENDDFLPLRSGHINYVSTFAFPFVCKNEEQRWKYIKKFQNSGIEIRPMIAGNMQLQPFYTKYVTKSFDLPNTQHLHDCGFYSGNYPELTIDDLNQIKNCLR